MKTNTLINCKGSYLDLSTPIVMGILNVTPDSFYDGGKYKTNDEVLFQAEKMLNDRVSILDIGGMSSRPGAEVISVEEEKSRVLPAIKKIVTEFPNSIISIDTIHGEVARAAVGEGAAIVNDISAGKLDKTMYETVADLNVPYILMHMKGKPKNMQKNITYEDVVMEVLDFCIKEVKELKEKGIKDVIIDPGFGFGKNLENNYEILRRLDEFSMLGLPILAGLSRKSMIYKYLDIKPIEALNGTTALHMIALQNGAKILRVHDVKEATECIKLFQALSSF